MVNFDKNLSSELTIPSNVQDKRKPTFVAFEFAEVSCIVVSCDFKNNLIDIY